MGIAQPFAAGCIWDNMVAEVENPLASLQNGNLGLKAECCTKISSQILRSAPANAVLIVCSSVYFTVLMLCVSL